MLVRFRRWAVWAIVAGVLLYVAGSVWADLSAVGEQLSRFAWRLYVPVLLLTLVNYGLRFVKWHYLLGRLGVSIPVKESATIFTAGLAMVISPGKAGELLKPYLVSRRTGVPMATTLPALISERLTDGIAVLTLAALSVSTYAADRAIWLVVPAAVIAGGLMVLASRRATDLGMAIARRLPLLKRLTPKLEELLTALRTCLAPGPLLITTVLSLVAWWAECVGFVLVFQGLGHVASHDASTFVYAFSTVAGGPSPGGLGVADGFLVALAIPIIGASKEVAVAAALLIRVATLWFGVLLGAFALLRFEDLLHGGIHEEPPTTSPPGDQPSEG